MNSLLSAISGQFSKTLLLSTLLPVVVFVLLALALVLPLIPQSVPWLEWVGSLDTEWKLAVLSLAVLLLTALLYNLSGPIIRLYEGYPWRESRLGTWRKGVHGRRFTRMRERWLGLWTLLRRDGVKNEPSYGSALDYWSFLGRELNKRYPTDEEGVLPTRLGNVIRSFEDYPTRQYGIDAITLWPRLIAKINERYAAQIDEAMSSLYFMLNGSLLCVLLALLFTFTRLYYPVGLTEVSSWLSALLVIGSLMGAAYFLYLQSAPRAQSWGMLVKGAFDLYRWDLLAALGPWEKPRSRQGEQALWDKVSNQLVYSNLSVPSRLPPDYELDTPTTAVTTEGPEEVVLKVARGVSLSTPPDRALTIRIAVRNADAQKQARGVSVQDRLPEPWCYEWDSAADGHGAVAVVGTNPYRFDLGDLQPGERIVLSYRAVQGFKRPDG